MKKKIVCTRGVPASGKTTWANEEVEKYGAVRLNKDDLRQTHPHLNEENIISLERHSAEQYIVDWQQPYIIIDNTHLKYKDGTENKHISFYKELAEKYGYEFEVKEFYINQEEAILRDKIRGLEGGRSVGEKVIKRFFKNMSTPRKYPENPTFVPYNPDLEDAIIVDIDGTLAFMDGKRSPYDYTKVKGDRFNSYLYHLLKQLSSNNKIIIVSGRKDDCFEETVNWLKDNRVNFDPEEITYLRAKDNFTLYMRSAEDNRCDTIVKKEIFDKHIKDKYNVIAVFDDRDRVVDAWRELGLPTYQVWYGDF